MRVSKMRVSKMRVSKRYKKHSSTSNEFEVSAIIRSRIQNNRREFLISWKKFSESSWEPLENLANCKELLDEFIDNFPLECMLCFNPAKQIKLLNCHHEICENCREDVFICPFCLELDVDSEEHYSFEQNYNALKFLNYRCVVDNVCSHDVKDIQCSIKQKIDANIHDKRLKKYILKKWNDSIIFSKAICA